MNAWDLFKWGQLMTTGVQLLCDRMLMDACLIDLHVI